jgi:hypothetical protein
MKLAAVLIASVISCACASVPRDLTAETKALAPKLYPLDPNAPLAYRQWPGERTVMGDTIVDPPVAIYGVAFEIWPDRAVLLVDSIPMWTQLRANERHLHVNRWDISATQCPAIRELFANVETTAGDNSGLGAPSVTEFFIRGKRLSSADELYPYVNWLGRAWRELDACSRTTPKVTRDTIRHLSLWPPKKSYKHSAPN